MSRRQAQQASYEWRLYVMLGLVLVLFASVAGRILFLQVLSLEGGERIPQEPGRDALCAQRRNTGLPRPDHGSSR